MLFKSGKKLFNPKNVLTNILFLSYNKTIFADKNNLQN